MITFKDAAALCAWLSDRNIDVTQWGIEQAKHVEDLWRELQQQETFLQDDPPLRLLEVVQVIVRRGDLFLMEAAQELEDGRTRQRNQPPAEKMKAGEDFLKAASRCLQEELGVAPEAIHLHPDTYRFVQYETDARSYPGLRAHYTFHTLEAEIDGLPQGDFWQENSSFADGDPVRRHLWAWHDGPIPFFDRFPNHN